MENLTIIIGMYGPPHEATLQMPHLLKVYLKPFSLPCCPPPNEMCSSLDSTLRLFPTFPSQINLQDSSFLAFFTNGRTPGAVSGQLPPRMERRTESVFFSESVDLGVYFNRDPQPVGFGPSSLLAREFEWGSGSLFTTDSRSRQPRREYRAMELGWSEVPRRSLRSFGGLSETLPGPSTNRPM